MLASTLQVTTKKRTHATATHATANLQDDDDEEGEVFVKDSSMIEEGKKAVVTVFWTIKFISSNEQQDQFCDAVMDNYGYPPLVIREDMTEAQKEEVCNYRKIFRGTYKKYWTKHLNYWRNYCQVSKQRLVIFTSHPKFSPQCNFF
ncbi:MAG: hypothetical protein ACRCZI_02000 [Cetobacterium sp.]